MDYVTAGESHGPFLTAIISGFPANVPLNQATLLKQLHQRQVGYGRGGRMKIETDQVQVTSGVRFGKTLGSPIGLLLANKDYQNWQHVMSIWDEADQNTPENRKRTITKPRPGHADLVGGLKYQHLTDLRNVLERASARETAMRVAVGNLCQQFLANFDIQISGIVTAIGPAELDNKTLAHLSRAQSATDFKTAVILPVQASNVRTVDETAAQQMRTVIDQAQAAKTTLGGKIRVVVQGLPAGLGSYVDAQQKLDACLSQSLMSINAIKGISFGDGFTLGTTNGRATLDLITYKQGQYQRLSNHQGGLEGGMTNGAPLLIDLVMKPIPTQPTGSPTIDVQTKESAQATVERSDTTAVPAASVIAEAMTAITIMQAFCDMFGADDLTRIKRNYQAYLDEIND